jgi:GrpB-like predicted nucleotidyltransferase (UPF0157 family)
LNISNTGRCKKLSKKLSEMSNEELWGLFPITLKEYNPEWVNWYNDEEELLYKIIGKDNIMRVNHIGSTSVDGLLAKPTVDILLEISYDFDVDELISILEQNEYICMVERKRNPLDLTLVKGYTERGFASRVFHIHIRYPGDWNELYFRDYLRINSDVAVQYQNLKMNLKKQYEHDRDAYTNAKSEFILKYTNIARGVLKCRYNQTK